MSKDNKDNNNNGNDTNSNEGHFGGSVGKGNPPKNTQFGQPGGNKRNENGRPKGSRNYNLSQSTIRQYLIKEATRPVKVQEGEEVEYLPKIQVIYRQLYNKAAEAKNHYFTKLAIEQIDSHTAQSDKERYEWLMGWINMTNKVSKSKAKTGSLEHISALHNYYSFKRDIRRIEGIDMWPYEEDEPISEKDWHLFESTFDKLRSGEVKKVNWPPKYPSEDNPADYLIAGIINQEQYEFLKKAKIAENKEDNED